MGVVRRSRLGGYQWATSWLHMQGRCSRGRRGGSEGKTGGWGVEILALEPAKAKKIKKVVHWLALFLFREVRRWALFYVPQMLSSQKCGCVS